MRRRSRNGFNLGDKLLNSPPIGLAVAHQLTACPHQLKEHG
jgi:hypothetical protein